ncbi:MAG: glycosyltransferase family 2 protein [Candidatus Curtissbacteria bacterium]|nr:glycosyltransferase family 2 protein [Candidatus Curtissbacteria bacterium]
MKIAIVVLNFNGLEDTLECLDSLRRLEIGKNTLEIIVVDNASQDGSAEAMSKLRDINLLATSNNLGFCGGNNLGIKRAMDRGADWILILNNDTTVDFHLIEAFLKDAKDADIITPKIYFAAGFEFHKSRYKKSELGKVIWYAGANIDWKNIIGTHNGVDEVDRGQFSKKREIDLATGACMFVSRKVFENIGLFDEKYFLYMEDMDFCVRAKGAGFKILFEPKAILWHKNAASTGGSGSDLQDYYITRNRLLFAARYAKIRTKIAVVRQIIKESANPIKRKALLDFFTFKFGKGSI